MLWFLLTVSIMIILAYHRASLIVWTISLTLLIVFSAYFNGVTVLLMTNTVLFLLIATPLVIPSLRKRLFSQRMLNFFRKVMPTMSRTEREAIHAGTVTWEGDIFRGNPNWNKLLNMPSPKLTAEEQAFMDGPLEQLCQMINDWDITQYRADLPPEMWRFLKEKGFFGLIVPKQYGGKGFSAYAQSQILIKIGGVSISVATTVAVPNSLGPAELLLHYGTEEQKQYYLPRLANGEEVPCFALTSIEAGSDAGAMTDYGIVCWGEFNGQRTIGLRLNWNKRYITLAPIATVIGLAFKMYDPDHLLGNTTDIGITCALIPRHTPGVKIGRRHFPLNAVFQNGPTQGTDVFVPIDYIIGGKEQAGKGWRMLMECLAAGRSITLPASAVGGAKVLCYAAGAYARIRKQFNVPISKFEGIEEPLARIASFTYLMDAARTLATSSINQGEKPAVASAIVKYHTTELARVLACDGMDVHGGKGICLGPHNYIGRGWQSAPIAITVEGANILTRTLIIFGQGAIRCHPYVLPEIEAARQTDPKIALNQFDKAVFKHIGFGISNVVRSFVLAITGGWLVRAPAGKTKHYYQQVTRFSSSFALIADVAMLALGSKLKRKESLSARLGDILSYLYILSATLKFYHDQGMPEEDLPVVRYASEYCLFQVQESFNGLIKNFPNKLLGFILKVLIFPLGQRYSRPKDRYTHKVAQLIASPSGTRQRLATGAYLTNVKHNLLADVQDALIKTLAAEPIEKLIKDAQKDKLLNGYTRLELAQSALDKKVITMDEFDCFMQAEDAKKRVLMVDDFDPDALGSQALKEDYVNAYAANESKHA